MQLLGPSGPYPLKKKMHTYMQLRTYVQLCIYPQTNIHKNFKSFQLHTHAQYICAITHQQTVAHKNV
jgi:hypothetical protein